VRGAFTGADTNKRGLFVAADGGTLFLDEIGELPLELQPKLLRALQDGEVKPVGGTTSVRVDARVIAATNRTLEDAIKTGTFREDLFYRLSVIHIDVPPLRDRLDDVPLLAEFFLARFRGQAARRISGFAGDALAAMTRYAWPGNVRELRNALERAVILAGKGLIERKHLPASFTSPTVEAPVMDGDCVQFRVGATVEEVERGLIMRTLEHTKNNKTKAADILGISLKTLHNKLKEYGATASAGAE